MNFKNKVANAVSFVKLSSFEHLNYLNIYSIIRIIYLLATIYHEGRFHEIEEINKQKKNLIPEYIE